VKIRGKKVLRPVHPNAGIAATYRARIDALVREMADSYLYWIKAQYRKTPPRMAMDSVVKRVETIEIPAGEIVWKGDGYWIEQLTRKEARTVYLALDETPARELERELSQIGKRWQRRFDEAAPRLARWFATSASRRSADSLRGILRDAGMTVEFKMTPGMRDVFEATIAENVALIKSISSTYHGQVQGLVMRSVAAGRDLGPLAKEIEARYGVTKRRAALIARDQNNKATAVMTRARQQEVGITEAIWLHSAGGKEPRKTHLANTGKKYDPAKGWFDPDPRVRKRIWPGELINCFPGSTEIDFAFDVEKAFRHFYRGQLTELVTNSGKSLRSTPNHPILTPDGWRPAGSLNEGDYVIEVSDDTVDPIKLEGDVDRAIATISKIFLTLSKARRSEIALGDEFHGDVIADGNIDVILPARPLSFGRKSLDVKSFEKFGLSVPDHSAFRHGSFSQLFVAALNSANRVMGCASEGSSFLRRAIRHPLEHSFASVANGPTYALDPGLDRLSLMPELPRQREKATPAIVQRAQAVRIIRVKRSNYSGHVFNLQTREGYYSAGGIICHNCRCVSRSVIKGFS
jgi:hypothetical protein